MQVDVRVLCASNRDLESLVTNGTFRQDLFYRINLFPIKIAPLRQRREDISLLAAHFLNQAMRKNAIIRHYRLAPETLSFLSEFDWPGNVRQLAFAVERAMLLSDHELLSRADFHFLKSPMKDVSRDLSAEIAIISKKWPACPLAKLPSGLSSCPKRDMRGFPIGMWRGHSIFRRRRPGSD